MAQDVAGPEIAVDYELEPLDWPPLCAGMCPTQVQAYLNGVVWSTDSLGADCRPSTIYLQDVPDCANTIQLKATYPLCTGSGTRWSDPVEIWVNGSFSSCQGGAPARCIASGVTRRWAT